MVGLNCIQAGIYYIGYIRNCLHALRQFCWHHCGQTKIYQQANFTPCVTVGPDFHFRHCGKADVTWKSSIFHQSRFQNVIGIWVNTHAAFVVNAKDPEAYLDLIRTPAKTIIQTGQIGAILLADALVVCLLQFTCVTT
jgi:hypothetical protein